MEWYLKVLKQYADFSGRARRKEYWMFVLFQLIFVFVAIGLDNLLGFTFGAEYGFGVGIFYIILLLGTLIPGLAVSVRRLHDTGKSGWWYLINLIPYVGAIIFLVLVAMDSERGRNKWGENPKGIGNDSTIDQIGTE